MTISTSSTSGANGLFAQLGLRSASSSANGSSGSNSTIGQDTFFKLMVTELTNQDPTKPVDSKNFLTQIAQFSQVAGIQSLQKSFTTLAGAMSNNQALQAAGLVGHHVLVPSNQATLDSTNGLNGTVDLQSPAQQVTVGIYGASGQLVRKIELGPQAAGKVGFNWNGISMDGQQMPPGSYTIRATAQGNGQAQAATVLVNAAISSITLGRNGGPVTLGLQGGGSVDLSQVREII